MSDNTACYVHIRLTQVNDTVTGVENTRFQVIKSNKTLLMNFIIFANVIDNYN